MELQYDSKLLRIFIGEADKLNHQPLYEALLFEARNRKLAGCTVLRGIMPFGASAHVHTAKLIEISQDLPVVLELVDEEETINNFAAVAGELIEKAGRGGLIIIEKAGGLYYKPKAKKN